MVDQALVQAKLNYGYGKAAQALGQVWTIYRPNARVASVAALDASYAVATTIGWLTADPAFASLRPIPPDKPIGYIAIDRTALESGDYLLGADGTTVFVGSVQPIMATPAIRCNHAFTVTRPEPVTPGANFYGGNAVANQVTILTAWPGFIGAKNRGVQPEQRIPGDTRLNTVTMMLPVTTGAQIMPNDILTDDQPDPKRYTVSIATSTDWGWAVEAYYAGA